MGVALKPGATIHLNLQLEDGDANQYPQAILRDQDGIELGASPVDLAHTGDGLYQDDSVIMPDTEEVTATYKVYFDNLHANLNPRYRYAFDVFSKDINNAIIENIEANVNAILAGALSPDLVAMLDDTGALQALLVEDNSLSASIADGGNIVAQLVDSQSLVGLVEDSGQQLIALLQDC